MKSLCSLHSGFNSVDLEWVLSRNVIFADMLSVMQVPPAHCGDFTYILSLNRFVTANKDFSVHIEVSAVMILFVGVLNNINLFCSINKQSIGKKYLL